jgi:uncharacterized membrane protein
MNRLHPSFWTVVALAWLLPAFTQISSGQETTDGAQSLVDFTRDVRPILEAKCLSCHGPDDAKNDFRVDDADSMLAYVEASDLEGSSLWTDYLLSDDVDMLMPPASADGQPAGLPGSELAVIKLWIEEGAAFTWPVAEGEEAKEVQHESPEASLAARIWAFQGLFHPASVHFPLALLMVSALFVFLSFFGRQAFEPVAYHCLWIGALGAVGSCVMGWAYAVHEGYGAGFGFDLRNSAIDRHRWLGIGVAVVSVLLVPIAHGAYKTGSINKKILWFLGAMLIALGVSITGYQGGELTYGEDHYQKEFERLFPEYAATPAPKTVELTNPIFDLQTDRGAGTAVERVDPAEVDASETPVDATDAAVEEVDSGTEAGTATEPDTATEADTVAAPPVDEPTSEAPISDAPVSDTPASDTPDNSVVEEPQSEPPAEQPPEEPAVEESPVEKPPVEEEPAPPLPPVVVNPSQPELGS